jgi:hypothetical protein
MNLAFLGTKLLNGMKISELCERMNFQDMGDWGGFTSPVAASSSASSSKGRGKRALQALTIAGSAIGGGATLFSSTGAKSGEWLHCWMVLLHLYVLFCLVRDAARNYKLFVNWKSKQKVDKVRFAEEKSEVSDSPVPTLPVTEGKKELKLMCKDIFVCRSCDRGSKGMVRKYSVCLHCFRREALRNDSTRGDLRQRRQDSSEIPNGQ